MSVPQSEERKEGRLARHLRFAREISAEPQRVVPLLRGWLAELWESRGGGFYGLGYVATFVLLEVRALGSIGGGESVSSFVLQQALQYVIRFSIESLFNVFWALLWPVNVLQWLGGWGIAVLAGGYVAFSLVLRPLIGVWFPELKEARARRVRLREEKRERKRLNRVRK